MEPTADPLFNVIELTADPLLNVMELTADPLLNARPKKNMCVSYYMEF